MNEILKKSENIYCVGIGGSGVSALASILHKSGKKISGSDQASSELTKKLENQNIRVNIGHQSNNVPIKTDLLIYSPAIKEDNLERQYARKHQIKELSYPQAIGELTKEKNTIAICGTHGKTTVTSMVSAIFIKAQKDPSVIVGSHITELENQNFRLGAGPDLIIEACEYCRNFLNYHPDTIILNNVEADHLDYYKNENDYIKAYIEFINKLPQHGLLIANNEDLNCKKIIIKIKSDRPDINIITFGIKSGDYSINTGNIFKKEKIIGPLKLQIPGDHNKSNALAATALAITSEIDPKVTLNALNKYTGAKRRFEYIGKTNKTLIYDDYAHHPTEIKATLKSIKEKFGEKTKVLCIFQPHQHSRTYKLRKDFAGAFNSADMTIISEIYLTRDKKTDISKIDGQKLVKLIEANNSNVIFGGNLNETLKKAHQLLKGYDLIITMGAGNITELARKLLKDITS